MGILWENFNKLFKEYSIFPPKIECPQLLRRIELKQHLQFPGDRVHL